MIKKIFILIFLTFINLENSYSKSPPPGTGTSNIPANILIMLDNSGSMSWDINGRTINSWNTIVRSPVDVSTDSQGNVYSMSWSDRKIRVFDSDGNYVKEIGSGYGWGCNQWIYAYHLDIQNDQIYIYDYYNTTIKVINLSGNCIKTKSFGGNWQGAGIAVSDNYVYVSGWFHGYIKVLDKNLNQVNSFSGDFSTYYGIKGIDVNSNGTKLVAAGYSLNKMLVFNISGANLSLAQWTGSYGSGNYQFKSPSDVAFDSSDNIYVADLYNHRLVKFDSSGNYLSKYGSWNYNSNPFRYPYGVGISSANKIYVADHGQTSIQQFSTGLSYIGKIGVAKSRMSIAKEAIKRIVSDPQLKSGANFGLMEWGFYWGRYLRLRVPISSNGASTIYTDVDGVIASGGTYLLQAMNYARNYWTGNLSQSGTRYPSPIISGATCQLNFNILISDGQWNSHSSAMGVVRDMKNRFNIKTFAVGLGIGTGNRSNYDSLAINGGTAKALYASSSAGLLVAIKDAVDQAISSTLTFTTPAVMPEKNKGGFIYQSTFKYDKNKEWEGSLKKYNLNSNGTFGAEKWDAAKQLNKTNPNSRKIWTAGIGIKNTNNFTTSNRSVLKRNLFPLKTSPTDAETDKLINFIRGFDSYDYDKDNNTSEVRSSKLADIYHSDLIVVGKPDAPTADTGNLNFRKTDAYYRQQNQYNSFMGSNDCGVSCSGRTEVVIAGANSGILHAFNSNDGNELWGYIPPNIIGKLSTIVTTKANATNPIYGVDGSPVVKDIFFDDTPNNNTNDPRWRTILISGLGAGGNGYFALDITDINNPKHLFAIENDTYNKQVNHWDSDENLNSYFYSGNSNPPSIFDYSKLGASWSTPRIIRIKVDGTDRWVAVFGGGYNGGVSPEYGSAIFIMDLENQGRLIKKIDIQDKQIAYHAYSFGVGKGVKEIQMSQFGLSSYNHNVEKLIVSGAGGMGFGITQDINGSTASNIKIILEQETPGTNNIFLVTRVNKKDIVNSLPSDLTVITADGTSKANYGGALIYAGDLEGKVTKVNLTESFILGGDKIINKDISTTTIFDAQANTENGRYIYNNLEATINSDNNLWLYFGTGDTQKLQSQSSQVKNRVFGIKDKDFPNYANISSAGTYSNCSSSGCPNSSQIGWYVELDKAKKVTAKATVDKDRIYFPTYEPSSSSTPCNTGTAYLHAYDTKCGSLVANFPINLGKGVAGEVVISGDNIYIGISGEANKSLESKNNLITLKSKSKGASSAVQLESWKENY